VALGSDPYVVLGVHRDATDSQIAQARRRLSREYHPDVNRAPDAAARFDEVQQAFNLLSDPAARAEYDRADGHPGLSRSGAAPNPGLATEAAPGIFISPAAVDFGLLTHKRDGTIAAVTVSWTGSPPGRITKSAPGQEWWTILRTERFDLSCVVFFLRARTQARSVAGRRHDQLTVTLDATSVTVQLSAEIRGVTAGPFIQFLNDRLAAGDGR
jgi:DnaJ domain